MLVQRKVKIMDDHNILIALAAIVSALGLKQVWEIVKQKIDINAKKEERQDNIYVEQIEQLSTKIQQLETKIDELIKENIHLKVKIVKMEARLVDNAKKKVATKRFKYE